MRSRNEYAEAFGIQNCFFTSSTPLNGVYMNFTQTQSSHFLYLDQVVSIQYSRTNNHHPNKTKSYTTSSRKMTVNIPYRKRKPGQHSYSPTQHQPHKSISLLLLLRLIQNLHPTLLDPSPLHRLNYRVPLRSLHHDLTHALSSSPVRLHTRRTCTSLPQLVR